MNLTSVWITACAFIFRLLRQCPRLPQSTLNSLHNAENGQMRRVLKGLHRRRYRLRGKGRIYRRKNTAQSLPQRDLIPFQWINSMNLHIHSQRTLSPLLELERLMNAAGPTGGTLLRPSDREHPHTIVFVQCVGSRCEACAEKGKEYCSKICCMYTAKHSMLIRDKSRYRGLRILY